MINMQRLLNSKSGQIATPENVDLLQYRDKAGNCFVYKSVDTPCPKNEAKLAKIPVQV